MGICYALSPGSDCAKTFNWRPDDWVVVGTLKDKKLDGDWL